MSYTKKLQIELGICYINEEHFSIFIYLLPVNGSLSDTVRLKAQDDRSGSLSIV